MAAFGSNELVEQVSKGPRFIRTY